MTTTHARPFTAYPQHWRENRRAAASVKVYPARMSDPEGTEHPGVALIVKGRPFLVLTLDEFKATCAAMLDAADDARR